MRVGIANATKHILWLILLFSSIYRNIATAQQISNVRFWGFDDGLPSRVIVAIEKDQNGYMWIGSQQGLLRFDGRQFVNFTTINPEFTETSIKAIKITYDSILIVGSTKGLFEINMNTYATRKLTAQGLPDHMLSVKTMHKYTDGSIIVGCNKNYLFRYERQQVQVIKNPIPESKFFEDIENFCTDDNGLLWMITTRKEIYTINIVNKQVTYLTTLQPNLFRIDYINHELLVLGVEGIYGFNYKTKTLQKAKLENIKETTDIINFSENEYGIVHKEQFIKWYTDNYGTDINSIFNSIKGSTYRIMCNFIENETIWVGTNLGLFKFNITQKQVGHFFTSLKQKNDKTNYSVRDLCQLPDKSIVFTCYEGLFIKKYPKNTIHKLTSGKFSGYSLSIDQNTLWIGTEGQGLYQAEIVNNTPTNIHSVSYTNQNIKPRFITCIYNDTLHKKLLMGTYAGIVIYDKTTGVITKPNNQQTINKILSEHTIFQIIKHNNHFWICSSVGTFWCDTNLKHIAMPTYLNILSTTPCSSIDVNNNNNSIWIGTIGKGVFEIQPSKQKITTYNFEKGLANDNIASICVSKNNIVFAGTYLGLSKINPEASRVQNYYTYNGLSHDEFNKSAKLKLSNGNIIMGGMNGYNIFNNNSFDNIHSSNNHILFTSALLLHNNKEQHIYNLKNNDTLHISNQTKVVELEFILPDYNYVEKTNYAYKIIGLDNHWISCKTRNFLRLIDLKGGEYTLQIIAAGADGRWTPTPVQLYIIAEGHFYEKWWFYVLLLILLIIGISIFYNIRINQLKSIYNLRLQLSTDLHDEVGSILTAVGMQAELLQHTTDNNSEELAQIADASRKAASNMRDVVWSIDSRNDKNTDLIDRMNDYLLLILEPANIKFTFTKHILQITHPLDLITKQNTYLIFKEAITNIVKHSTATQINITLTINNQHLELLIINNGDPKSDKKTRSGMGLRNIKQRAEKMNATYSIDEDNHYQLNLLKKR